MDSGWQPCATSSSGESKKGCVIASSMLQIGRLPPRANVLGAAAFMGTVLLLSGCDSLTQECNHSHEPRLEALMGE